MESLFRPRYGSRSSSGKLSNASGFAAGNAYDDLFAGPRKFGAPTLSPSVEDYADIFGGSQASRASSIPMIDLSALEEAGSLADVRSSKPDYSDIFGGFRDEETALSFEEMCKDPKGGDYFSFSGKAWTSAKTMPHYEGSDGFNDSKGNQMFSNESDGLKRFNMSFHKTSPRRNSGKNGTTRVAQFHAVPGFTYFVDENNMQKKDCDKSVPLVKNAVNHNMDFKEGKEGKHQTMSNLSKQQTSDSRVKFENLSRLDGFHSNDKSFHEFDISPKAREISQPSGLPAKLGSSKGDSKVSMASNFKIFKNDPSKGGAGDCSPPFSDEEIDVNSAAAASVAALRKAIEKAQASIRIVKESMERKDGLQGFSKLSYKRDLDTKDRKVKKISGEANKMEKENAKGLCERMETVSQVLSGIGRHSVTRSSKMPTRFKDDKECLVVGKLTREANGIRSELAEECETAKQCCETVNTSKHRAKSLISEQTDSNSNTMQSADADECATQDMKPGKDVLEQVEGNGNKAVEEVLELDNMEAKPNAARMAKECEEHASKLVSAQEDHRLGENEIKVAQDSEASEKKQKTFDELEKCEKGLKESQEPIENERFECQDLREYDNQKGQDEVLDWMENEKKQEEVLQQKQSEKILKDAHEKEENESRLQKIREQVEKRLKEACEWIGYGNKSKVSLDGECIGYGNKPKVSLGGESNEKKQNYAQKEDNEMSLDKAYELEMVRKKLSNSYDSEEIENKLEEDCEWEGNEKKHMESHEFEETESIWRGVEWHKENEKIRGDDEAFEEEKSLDAASVASETNVSESTCLNQEVHIYEEKDSSLDISQQVTAHEDYEGKLYADEGFCDFKEDGNETETFEVQLELEEKGMCKTGDSVKGVTQHIEIENKNKTASRTFPFHENPIGTSVITTSFGQEPTDQNERESEFGSNGGYDTEISEHELGESEERVMEAAIAFDPELEEERIKVEMEASRPQLGAIKDRVKNAETAFDLKQDESNFEIAAKDREEVELENKMEESQPYNLFYLNGEGKMMEIEEEIATNQSKGESENFFNEASAVEEKETKGTMQKEVLSEREHLKTEGANKGEREREKDRIAVERVIREARERAFAEARERAERAAVERATAEARQRVMVEAREKFEKTSGGSKSSSEKTSIEAKLRAERAAVERATAEARERALEKALSQKATSGVSRDNGVMRSFSSSDLHRSDESNGESAQRRKASLERHQRTMERAAKALEEKNMRDLLAQKEQAERNRLAEVLDADVKRWSSGKEGNLRALLSTLQYILGPNSGWQPVSLTDIITTNAVKKAYRKATLCVHPDKLQQRGASIQQKYICEKVFDLLKAAWNKFNSEER